MKTFKFSGFPTQAESKIELPDIAELLEQNFHEGVSCDDLYKYGSQIYRDILDKTPLGNDRKYAVLTARVQILRPNEISIKYHDDWHVDGQNSFFDCNNRIHLLVSNCTSLTEFNVNPFELEVQDNAKLDDINKIVNKMDLTPKSIEPNRFYTFDVKNAHRAVNPSRTEFRFMFRIIESNTHEPRMYKESMKNSSHIYKIGKRDSDPNITKTRDGILIHKQWR
jgi:hypothetical protein